MPEIGRVSGESSADDIEHPPRAGLQCGEVVAGGDCAARFPSIFCSVGSLLRGLCQAHSGHDAGCVRRTRLVPTSSTQSLCMARSFITGGHQFAALTLVSGLWFAFSWRGRSGRASRPCSRGGCRRFLGRVVLGRRAGRVLGFRLGPWRCGGRCRRGTSPRGRHRCQL
jgi:hypothetical protein